MAFLNASERESLQRELQDMNLNQGRRRILSMDSKARLAYFRNSQMVDKWMTRYDLRGLGVRVTFLESLNLRTDAAGDHNTNFQIIDVVVEPRPENQT